MPHPISLADAERAVRLVNAVYRSAEDGTPVRLDTYPASAVLGRPDPELETLHVTPPASHVGLTDASLSHYPDTSNVDDALAAGRLFRYSHAALPAACQEGP